ncbi:hypothetical protein BGZ95_006186, partial [Linnemannia exigua]
MKSSALVFITALVSSAHAIKIAYKAHGLGPRGKRDFQGTMWVYNNVFSTNTYRGASEWKSIGIHRAQLRNADFTSFDYCIDVYGNIDCSTIPTLSQTCKYDAG